MDSEKNSTTPVKSASGRRLQNRDRLEADILEQAVRVFAESGYEGASIATIAERSGLSKQNLMYYFPTKQQLYQRVLDDVLDDWLARMDKLASAAVGEADGKHAPQDMLRAYIAAKLRFSREQPWASRVYALEVINGAPLYGGQIRERVVPLLRKDIAMFEAWSKAGKIAPVNATHLMFAIWAMTQSYADFSAQMTLVLDQGELTQQDFHDAEALIVQMVLAAVAI